MTTAPKAEEALAECRKWIGVTTEPVPNPYPVEHDPIRRYCHMVDDDNPLYLDPAYAASTEHGAVIAPPFFAATTRGAWPPATGDDAPLIYRVPTPGRSSIVLGTEYEPLRPIRVGDRLSAFQRIADVYIKSIKLDPKAFWVVTENVTVNQRGEEVIIQRSTICRHRTPDQVRAAGDALSEG